MTALQFRCAGHADIDAVVALVQLAYRGEASRRGWTTEADLLDGQRVDAEGVGELITRPDSQVVLAFLGTDLVGCIHVERLDGQGYFGMFSVHPERQGGGIGDRLLGEAERLAQDRFAVTRMCCTVISLRSELIAWYQRRGYRSTGEFKPFPYGDARFGLPKRDDLRFEVFEKELV